MKCERCQINEATRAVDVEKDGYASELFVCEACAGKTAEPPPTEPPAMPKLPGPISLTDILFSLEKPGPSKSGQKPARKRASARSSRKLSCNKCGMTRDVLLETRRFGCANCYETFVADVQLFLQEMQFGDTHVGRAPRKADLQRRLARLRTSLAQAIANQRFDDAARLRDELKAMAREQYGSGESPDGEA